MFVLAVHSERFKRKRKKDSPPKGFIGPMRKHRKDVSVMDMRQFTITLTLCLSCQAFLVRGVPQLIQIQVVTRHGARTVLTKQAATLAEGGSSDELLGRLVSLVSLVHKLEKIRATRACRCK